MEKEKQKDYMKREGPPNAGNRAGEKLVTGRGKPFIDPERKNTGGKEEVYTERVNAFPAISRHSRRRRASLPPLKEIAI